MVTFGNRADENFADEEWINGDYECLHCQNRCDIDGEHKRIASNWCKLCEQVRKHERRDRKP